MSYLNFHKLPSSDKIDIFESIQYSTGLPGYAAEKDWWVVRVLDVIFKTEIAKHTVFKGGTSLSKAWGLIHRFSEDVDLALDRSFLGFDSKEPTKKEITRLRKASKEYIIESLVPQIKEGFEEAQLTDVDIKVESTQESDQDPVIIIINYPNVMEYTDYVLPRVLVEIGIRSPLEPFTPRALRSVVAEEYLDKPFADTSITIPTVNPERTLLDKLFLLHEEFQRPKDKMRVDRLSRHLYDIHQLAKSDYLETAIGDRALYDAIVKHRSTFTKLGGVDYQSHFPPNLNPIPPDAVISDWKKDYATMDEQMIYGESVKFEALIETLGQITNKINGQ
jgi:hypothetical protein